jgi:Flp pilus assembly pilin Flp
MHNSIQEWLLLLAARLQAMAGRERGQTLAEYGLIITIVAVGVTVLAMITFRTQITGAWNSATTCLNGGC